MSKLRPVWLIVFFALALSSLVLAGCQVTQMTKQYFRAPDLSNATPETGKARIFVIRPIAHQGFAAINVYDDRALVGELDTAAYLVWERPAGSCTLKVFTKELETNLEAGKTYYYKAVLVALPFNTSFDLELISDKEALLLLPKLDGPIKALPVTPR